MRHVQELAGETRDLGLWSAARGWAHCRMVSKHRSDPFVLTNRFANPVLLTLLKSRAGEVLGRSLAVVGYDGRRTEQPHELVARYRLDGSIVRIAVGMPGRKHWWRNFATPHPAALRLEGRDHLVLAHVEHDGDAVTVTADLDGLAHADGDHLPSTARVLDRT